MSILDIGRLAIDAPHLGEEDAQRLAQQIAAGLRSEVPQRDESAAVEGIRLSVDDAGGGVDGLAEQIVAELLRELERIG